jgi:hypothetical protein
MWPILVALGVYFVCEGIQKGIDENREQNRRMLPPPSKDDTSKYLPRGDYDLLDDDNWRKR